jgi:D-3-phosphoglycerate dehydrogenase
MKVLVADKFEKSGLDGLQQLGCEVIYNPDLKEDSLRAAIGETGAEVVIVRSTKITEPMMDAGHLTLIVRAGAGYDNIDVKAASGRGIYVANCPGKNSLAVAELAFGLILALDRRIPDNVIDLRAGKWNKKEYSKARGLHGRTLGIIGFGNIGQEMARRAQAFGMHIAIWSEIGVEVDRAGMPVDMPLLVRLRPSSGFPLEPFAEVCETPEEVADRTRKMINANVLGRLKPGSFFINTARGEVVDYDALALAVKERNLRVALDVYAKEPSTPQGEFTDPIVQMPNVYGTHHIGASTDQAQEAIAGETVRILKTYIETGRVLNVVNLSRQTPASHVLVVRHRDQPGVLAHVFDILRDGRVNVQETENIIFTGAQAAVARINLDGEPSDDQLRRIKTNPNVFDVQVVLLGAPAASYQLAKSLSTW